MKWLRLLVVTTQLAAAALALGQEALPLPTDDERAKWEPGALAWMKQNSVAFESDVPMQSELKPMIEWLQDARVVGIGESTHGDRQSQLFKTHLIRELVRQGKINSLMLEINRAPAAEFDAYVNEGKGDLARLMSESGLFSIWRNDEFGALMMWLRAYVIKTGKPIRVYGIDCQDPSADFGLALDRLSKKDRRTADRLRKELDSVLKFESTGKTYIAWTGSQPEGSFARHLALAKELVAAMEKTGDAEGIYAAKAGQQALESYEFEFGPGPRDYSKMPPEYFSRRDRFMGENLMHRLGDGKAALWAHDGHVMGNLPKEFIDMGYVTLGSAVRTHLQNRYLTVTFAWTTGAIHAKRMVPDEPIEVSQKRTFEPMKLTFDRAGDLGEFLGRVGKDRFFVDLRRADEATRGWGSLNYIRAMFGWGFDPNSWREMARSQAAPTLPMTEILVYHRTVSPSTLWFLPTAATAQ
ncbi:MAG: erythromycin esterase family protein [Armatimonadetes bacterium]|nr:erythromycin esterase family protein [Armatimonadota bacterium]